MTSAIRKKKILFVAPRFHTNQFYLTKQLIEYGYEVDFLAIFKGKSENYEHVQPFFMKASRFSPLPSKAVGLSDQEKSSYQKMYMASFKDLFRYFKESKPDVAVIRDFEFAMPIQTLLSSFLFGTRIILYTQVPLHQTLNFKKRIFFNAIKKLGIKQFTPVLGEQCLPELPGTYYVPFIMDMLTDKPTPKKKDIIQLVTIGKMVPRKSIRELVIALTRSAAFNKPSNKLIIISECISEANQTYYADLITLIEQNEEIEFQITFKLNIPHEQVVTCLKESDVFILPSNKEPAAVSPLEAMACGLPVICSDENGTKDYITHGDNGYVFQFAEFNSLANYVEKLCVDKRLMSLMGENSLKTIKRNHQVESFLRKLDLI